MNRYGITVDKSKTEAEQIIQLRSEHLKQYPRIIFKNPDFECLRDFVTNHPSNQTDMMKNAPGKIKILNVMKDFPEFEYATAYINSYAIEYNSFHMQHIEFIKWLTTNFPKNFDWSLKQCKNKAILSFIYSETVWIEDFFNTADLSKCAGNVNSLAEISVKTRIYGILHNVSDFPKCRTCGKYIVSNVKSVFDGFITHCDESCVSLDPDVQEKIQKTCNKNFGSSTYLGSKAGIETKRQKLLEKYGDEQYSRTNNWRQKVEDTSMTSYGTKWPSQNKEIRKRISESNRKSSAENVKKGLKTKKQRRNGKFWTDEELQRISEGNKSPENQAKRLERAKRRRIKYYNERLLNNAYVKPLFTLEEFIRVPYKELLVTDMAWECQKCGTVFDAPLRIFYTDSVKHGESKTYARCPHCYPNRRKSSLEEFKVKEFIETILPDNSEIIYGQYENFNTIKPFQLDIIVRDKISKTIKFAIEFNGVKWHSMENSNNINKQLRKTIMCEKLGIPLVHVFEDEWLYDRENTEKLLAAYVSGEFRNMVFTEKDIVIDRGKFNKAVKINGYRLVGETEPEIIERRGLKDFGANTYMVPDCGKLIYSKIERRI